jgi:signal transduction histidine kinase/DNA-binding response OmpR family regulator
MTIRLSVIGLLIAPFLLGACGENHSTVSDTTQRRAEIEQQLEGVHTIDSLQILADRFRMEGDVLGEMMALRQMGETLRDEHRITEAIDLLTYLASLAEKEGDTIEWVKALEHLIEAAELQDSVTSVKEVINVQNARMAVERDLMGKMRENAENDLQHAQHKQRLTMLVAVIIILLALSFIAMLSYVLHARSVKHRATRMAQKARETFFTNVTHEFRTPLTVIQGLGQQLEDDEIEDKEQVRSAAKMIVRQSNSLLALINQLLDVSKVRSAIGEPPWRRGNIVAFVAMILENYQPYADSKRIELTYSHSLTSIETDFIPDYIQKIVANLLSNAIKYTNNYGKVNVTLEQTTGNRLKLQVFDTGRGIDPESLPHVFEPFYQEEKSTNDVGTGIGLSLVKLMGEAMGGQVEVSSVAGKGSTFTVLLPLRNDKASETLQAKEWKEKASSMGLTGSAANDMARPGEGTDKKSKGNDPPYRILIVEDNQDIAYYIGMHLEKMAQLTYARSGEDAMEKATELMPNLIITDIMMPGSVDGLQLCRMVRGSETLGNIPIIIITAKNSEADRVKGLEAGADAYLVKPFSSEELLVRVNKLLEWQAFIKQLMAHNTESEQEPKQLSMEDQRFVGKVVDATYKLMTQGKTDVDALAALLGLSHAQLNRRVMAATGQSVSNYMMRVRLCRAKKLLKGSPQMPISEVAQKCGFGDMAYFSRIFKQNAGITPSQYRRTE